MRARLIALPGPVWTMLLWAGGALLNALALGLWFSPAPGFTGWIVQVVFQVVVIVVLLTLGGSTPTWLLHVILLLQIWAIEALCLLLGDPVSIATWSVGAIGAVLYASYWWHGWVSFAYAVLVSAGMLVVIGITGTWGALGMAWFIITSMSFALALGMNALVGRLERQARRDTLTGLLNRVGLDDYLDLHGRAGRTTLPRALVVVDIDGFKSVNDTRGHQAGDRVLQCVTRAWSSALRPDDLAVRIGGDEFLLLLPHTDVDGARALVTRLRELDGTPWSCGIVDWTDGETFDTAIVRADSLMYEDKARRQESPAP